MLDLAVNTFLQNLHLAPYLTVLPSTSLSSRSKYCQTFDVNDLCLLLVPVGWVLAVLGVGLRFLIGVESGCVPGLPPNRGSLSSPTLSSSSPVHPQARRLSLMEPEPEPDPAMACGGGGIEGVDEVGVRPIGGVGVEEGFCSPRRIWVMQHYGGGAPDVVFETRRPATCGVAERLGSPDGGGWGPPAPDRGGGGSSQGGQRPAEGRSVAATVVPMLELSAFVFDGWRRWGGQEPGGTAVAGGGGGAVGY
jgi:hypothetical protein